MAAGKCARCGERPPVKGRRECTPCYQRERDRKRAARPDTRPDYRCSDCGAPTVGAARCYECWRAPEYRPGGYLHDPGEWWIADEDSGATFGPYGNESDAYADIAFRGLPPAAIVSQCALL
ncbi:MAG: hypothetical protein F4233_06620 [Rhodospirillaceae bacterium]|nr:hypothetical protein [Rhodospirillaceae bacterium]